MKAWLAAALAASLAGCTAMLPRSQTQTQDGWQSFDEARSAIENILPGRSTREELSAAGLDPYENPAVTLLSFSDVVQRFAVGAALKAEELDEGIRSCLRAGKACTGYSVAVQKRESRRTGGFWADFLNFKREVDVTGWTFNALILLVDDTVVYTLYGGQPKVHDHEVTRNPLGPIQGRGADLVPSVR